MGTIYHNVLVARLELTKKSGRILTDFPDVNQNPVLDRQPGACICWSRLLLDADFIYEVDIG
jgi:hypothetical protein